MMNIIPLCFILKYFKMKDIAQSIHNFVKEDQVFWCEGDHVGNYQYFCDKEVIGDTFIFKYVIGGGIFYPRRSKILLS